jgi:fatty acyl-CoA reductase
LGLSVADLKELSENCEIIMNCAASIDFNARLDDAININIKGTFRMMELAKKCQRLLTFTHVSTCYVNCNLQGRIREEIYPKNSDPDVELKNLLAIPSSEIVKRTDEVL